MPIALLSLVLQSSYFIPLSSSERSALCVLCRSVYYQRTLPTNGVQIAIPVERDREEEYEDKRAEAISKITLQMPYTLTFYNPVLFKRPQAINFAAWYLRHKLLYRTIHSMGFIYIIDIEFALQEALGTSMLDNYTVTYHGEIHRPQNHCFCTNVLYFRILHARNWGTLSVRDTFDPYPAITLRRRSL